MTVEEILDQLDESIDKALRLPLTGGKCLMDAEDLRNNIEKIRAALPNEIAQARKIVRDRAVIVSDANKEAEDLVRTAEERARRLVQEEEVVRQAQEKATDIMNQTQKNSREMRRSAYEFSEGMLKRTEEALIQQLTEVRQVRQSLNNSKNTVQAPVAPAETAD